MDQPNWTEVWTAYGTVATAFVSFGLGVIGVFGLRQWKVTLRSQRVDECVSAARDLEGAIGRVISLKCGTPNGQYSPDRAAWDAYTPMWDSWRRFNQAFTIMYRYNGFSTDIPQNIASLLYELEDFLHGNWAADSLAKTEGLKLQKRINQALEETIG
jgi:hypothetical protein